MRDDIRTVGIIGDVVTVGVDENGRTRITTSSDQKLKAIMNANNVTIVDEDGNGIGIVGPERSRSMPSIFGLGYEGGLSKIDPERFFAVVDSASNVSLVAEDVPIPEDPLIEKTVATREQHLETWEHAKNLAQAKTSPEARVELFFYLLREAEVSENRAKRFQEIAMTAWGGKIPSPLPGHISITEDELLEMSSRACSSCGGSGLNEDESDIVKCEHCQGRGYLGIVECKDCKGSGQNES